MIAANPLIVHLSAAEAMIRNAIRHLNSIRGGREVYSGAARRAAAAAAAAR